MMAVPALSAIIGGSGLFIAGRAPLVRFLTALRAILFLVVDQFLPYRLISSFNFSAQTAVSGWSGKGWEGK